MFPFPNQMNTIRTVFKVQTHLFEGLKIYAYISYCRIYDWCKVVSPRVVYIITPCLSVSDFQFIVTFLRDTQKNPRMFVVFTCISEEMGWFSMFRLPDVNGHIAKVSREKTGYSLTLPGLWHPRGLGFSESRGISRGGRWSLRISAVEAEDSIQIGWTLKVDIWFRSMAITVDFPSMDCSCWRLVRTSSWRLVEWQVTYVTWS